MKSKVIKKKIYFPSFMKHSNSKIHKSESKIKLGHKAQKCTA